MSFQRVDSLKSRTFIGLLVAQFFAAFNDQAIHASAMFFAINHKTFDEAKAISLMPILFYAPWALFCTLSGWLADRFSKRQSLIFWKIAEVGITATALLGFWLGTAQPTSHVGPWIVLSTVFLMGTHSAFFVPAKYGVMPEILPPHLLSKGNGLLESLSFLAIIFGTVSGGLMSYQFKDMEYLIGVVLVTLAVIGAVASFLIEKMPAADPERPFPKNLFKPLFENLRVMLRSRPLALAVLGIAFFTFMVAFMRGTVYMHGETRNPRWTELQTSLVVGAVALGIGLGSPGAGFLSGGKIELGLVPLGALGMIVSLLLAVLTLSSRLALAGSLAAIGFCTGFYIVPLFSLLQHRAPTASKGDLLASSNFINVTGAIAASLLFWTLVLAARCTGLTPAVPMEAVARGTLAQLEFKEGRPARFVVDQPGQNHFARSNVTQDRPSEDKAIDQRIIEVEGRPEKGDAVIVASYDIERQGRKVQYYRIEPDLHPEVPLSDYPLHPVYNKEPLTSYLFLCAGLMTLAILLLLCRELPDFFVRSLLWLRALGRCKLHVVGLHHIPTDEPVILTTNCDRFADCLHVVAATDRYTRFLIPDGAGDGVGGLLSVLARRTSRIPLSEDPTAAVTEAGRTLRAGNVVGLAADAGTILPQLLAEVPALVVPVRYVAVPDGVRVVFGEPLKVGAGASEIEEAIRALADVTGGEEGHAAVGAMH
jgi:MFS family permease